MHCYTTSRLAPASLPTALSLRRRRAGCGRRSTAAPAVFALANTFGTSFRVTTFGESHGGGVGCVVDGVPPRLQLSTADVQARVHVRWDSIAGAARVSRTLRRRPLLWDGPRAVISLLLCFVPSVSVLPQFELDRRRPGQSRITTPRNEEDTCEILSGACATHTCNAVSLD